MLMEHFPTIVASILRTSHTKSPTTTDSVTRSELSRMIMHGDAGNDSGVAVGASPAAGQATWKVPGLVERPFKVHS